MSSYGLQKTSTVKSECDYKDIALWDIMISTDHLKYGNLCRKPHTFLLIATCHDSKT